MHAVTTNFPVLPLTQRRTARAPVRPVHRAPPAPGLAARPARAALPARALLVAVNLAAVGVLPAVVLRPRGRLRSLPDRPGRLPDRRRGCGCAAATCTARLPPTRSRGAAAVQLPAVRRGPALAARPGPDGGRRHGAHPGDDRADRAGAAGVPPRQPVGRTARSTASWWTVGWLLPAALFLEPVRNTLNYGQVNVALMALVAADCLAAAPRWPRGALVGLAAAVKLTPAAFVLFFLLRRDSGPRSGRPRCRSRSAPGPASCSTGTTRCGTGPRSSSRPAGRAARPTPPTSPSRACSRGPGSTRTRPAGLGRLAGAVGRRRGGRLPRHAARARRGRAMRGRCRSTPSRPCSCRRSPGRTTGCGARPRC